MEERTDKNFPFSATPAQARVGSFGPWIPACAGMTIENDERTEQIYPARRQAGINAANELKDPNILIRTTRNRAPAKVIQERTVKAAGENRAAFFSAARRDTGFSMSSARLWRIIAVFLCLSGFGALPASADGPKVPARPVARVEAQALPAPGGPVVIELFSSQACAFCPQADRLFGDLIKQPDVVGLDCHVDYFDVRRGALSHPFCTARQTRYEELLHAGPNYTPQMVMQGQFDVIGYKTDAVNAGIKAAQTAGAAWLKITPSPQGFSAALPPGWKAPAGAAPTVWLMLYDRPHSLTVAGGRNRGQAMTYSHIVSAMSDLGPWPADQDVMTLTPPLTAGQQGFAVLLQDKNTGRILAAGKYEVPG
jgi:hypothetical protein